MWVAGEIHRLRPSPKGHLYFELIEKGERDDIVGRIEGVIFRADRDRVRGAYPGYFHEVYINASLEVCEPGRAWQVGLSGVQVPGQSSSCE